MLFIAAAATRRRGCRMRPSSVRRGGSKVAPSPVAPSAAGFSAEAETIEPCAPSASRMTRSMARQQHTEDRARKGRNGVGSPSAPARRSKKRRRKRRTATDDGAGGSKKRRRRTTATDHRSSKAGESDGESDGEADKGEGDGEDTSSDWSSPLREPYIARKKVVSDGQQVDQHFLLDDLDLYDLYAEKRKKIREKTARQMELPTLTRSVPKSCFSDKDLLSTHEAATKTVLGAAKFVLGLSSSHGGKQLRRCSGFLISWDETRKRGTILTTSDIICSSYSFDYWSGENVYSTDAMVLVHLLDNTSVVARLIYFQKHYNLALFDIEVDSPIQLPTFSSTFEYGQQVFMLGRDEQLYLRINHGRVLYSNPLLGDQYHYMYVDTKSPKCVTGGIVIDYEGEVVGMTCGVRSFIPCSVMLNCLHIWRKFECIPRPQLGLKLWAIKFLDPPQIEMISRKCHICDGLIVKEVSEGCAAEKLGVRVGDIIEGFNGECILDTIELEKKLLQICEDNFDKRNKGNILNSILDIELSVFHIRKGYRRVIKLPTSISDNGDLVIRGRFPISSTPPAGEDVSTLLLPDQSVQGK